ncbi:hypothetical protein BGX26_011933 [Mortierella sp. AD094]|nr:hypothetical protein BGX26_011933 [Mortierella sp. AD094]
MSCFNFSVNLPVLQLFRSEDGLPLGGLPTYVSKHTKDRYVLWLSVENVFPDKSHIQDENDSRILFMTDKDYRMYVNILSKHESDMDYAFDRETSLHFESSAAAECILNMWYLHAREDFGEDQL